MRNRLGKLPVRDAALAACAFLLLRLIVLLCSGAIYIDSLEEVFTGNLAADTLNGGRTLPLREYMIGPSDGGSLLMSMAAIPAFRLFGASFFTLKLMPVLLGALTVALLYCVVTAFSGRGYAVVACALFAFPSSNYIYWQVRANMRHQSLLLVSLALLLVLRMQCADTVRRKNRWALLGGVVAALSVYCIASNVLAAALITPLCVHAWHHDRFRAKAMRWLCAVAVFIPVALYLLPHTDYFLHYLPPPRRSALALPPVHTRLAVCLGPAGLASFKPWHGVPEGLALIGYLAALAAYLHCVTRIFTRRCVPRAYLDIFVVAYPVLYLSLLCCSGLTDGLAIPYDWWSTRWLVPLLGIFVLSEALLVGDLVGSRRRITRAAGWCTFATLLFYGAASLYSALFPVKPGYGFEQAGYFLQETGARVTEATLQDSSQFAAAMERIDRKPAGSVRIDLARGAAWLACLYRVTDHTMQATDPRKFGPYVRMVEERVPPNLRQLFKEELGSFVLWHSGFDVDGACRQLGAGLAERDAEPAYLGIARVLPARSKDPALLRALLARIPARDGSRLAFAMGQYFACEPGEETARNVAAVAAGLRWGSSFLAGAARPYGTRMSWSPISLH